MGEFGEHYCPNPFCKKEKLTNGEEKCPECGAYVYELDAKELAKLLRQKKNAPTSRESKGSLFSDEQERDAPKSREAKNDIFSDEMTDEQIRMLILKDIHNLAMHEAGTLWMSPGTLPSNSTDQMLGSGFKALIYQNKIIIRQNELVIRELKRLAEKTEGSRHS
ncbi:MAG TPA: hypothetical protein VMT42_01935 [candidate division Zixibacteria bacterium]|nr:hypothetical protein [candidate division Zixibacteria bacterium]